MRECPDKCSGGSADRQSRLTQDQIAELSAGAQQEIGSSRGMAFRCESCGCVYLAELTGRRKLEESRGRVH